MKILKKSTFVDVMCVCLYDRFTVATSIDGYVLFTLFQLERQTNAAGLFLIPYETIYRIMSPNVYHESSVRHSVNSLCNDAMLQKELKDSISYISVTTKGRKDILDRYEILDRPVQPKPLNALNDWWMITFDVPEDKRSIRDALRDSLVRFGFTPWQKSLYVYPRGTSRDSEIVNNFWVKEYQPYISLMNVTDVVSKPLISDTVMESYDLSDKVKRAHELMLAARDHSKKLKSRALNNKQFNTVLLNARVVAKDIYQLINDISFVPPQLITQLNLTGLVKIYDSLIASILSTYEGSNS